MTNLQALTTIPLSLNIDIFSHLNQIRQKNLSTPWQPSNPERLGKQFSRLGWIGFWMQLVLISIPIVLAIYVLFLAGPESPQQRGIKLSNYLSYGSLLIMLFTTIWFFRYTRVGRRIADPELRPPQSSVTKTLWIGLWASCLGIASSMVLLINAVGRMLFILLATPQTGIPLAAPVGEGDPRGTLSAIDALSLSSLIIILAVELILLAFTLWLLFRVTRPSAERVEPATHDEDLSAPAQ